MNGGWEVEYNEGEPTRMSWNPERNDDFTRTHARNRDPATSHEAAPPTRKKQSIWKNLEAVFRRYPRGLTAHEAAELAGYSDADGAWKRVSDLLADGLIESTGQTKPGPHGRMQRVLRWVPREPEQDELW
jgi:hypothetical protein